MSMTLVYAIPDPNRSDAEARKRAHQDLRGLSEFGLWRELHRLEDVLAWDEDPHPWLLERYKAVCTERSRRGR